MSNKEKLWNIMKYVLEVDETTMTTLMKFSEDKLIDELKWRFEKERILDNMLETVIKDYIDDFWKSIKMDWLFCETDEYDREYLKRQMSSFNWSVQRDTKYDVDRKIVIFGKFASGFFLETEQRKKNIMKKFAEYEYIVEFTNRDIRKEKIESIYNENKIPFIE